MSGLLNTKARPQRVQHRHISQTSWARAVIGVALGRSAPRHPARPPGLRPHTQTAERSSAPLMSQPGRPTQRVILELPDDVHHGVAC